MARSTKKTQPLVITPEHIEEARGWHMAIKANVDRFYSDSITHAEFSENQRKTWEIIGTKCPEVCVALRDLMLDGLVAARAA